MCAECPPEVLDLARRLSVYLGEHGLLIDGGLHIVIEDENVETSSIEWCAETQQLDDESKQFAADLLKLPVPHRHMAVELAWTRVHADDDGDPVYDGWSWESP